MQARAKHIASSRRYIIKQKSSVDAYLRDHPCVDCGESDLRVLEFDHVRGDKFKSIAQMYSYCLQRIMTEIAKCDVRCANCHRIRHWEGYENRLESDSES